jgi:hypothetical protein
METESVAKRAIALIAERGTLRSDQIAEALGLDKTVIATSLTGHVNNGTLVACKVQRPGSAIVVNEYRISASGKTPGFRQYKPKETGRKTPPVPVPASAAAAAPAKPKRAYKRRAPVRKTPRTGLQLGDQATALPPAAAGDFRVAIASDGAMLFLDAKVGAFELNRAETRAVIEFVRTLDRGEAGASAQGAST